MYVNSANNVSTLPHTGIGFADEMHNQDKMEKKEFKFIKAMTKQVKISSINENKSSKWTSEAKQKHVEKPANLNVLHEYKGRYKQ